MAWPISITNEGWDEIRAELGRWGRDDLIAALCDDTFERVYQKGGEHHALRAAEAEKERLEPLPHDLLVDRAVELIEQNDTCDNRGWAYWIDRAGYHRVVLPGGDD